METVAINGVARTPNHKKGAKAVRRQGLIPCVVYGGDNVIHIAVDPHEINPLIYTPDFKKAVITCNGDKHECIIRDIQFHPVTEDIVHVDFLKLVPGRKVQVEVPLRFEGTAAGMKEGGRLVQRLRKISIKTYPEYLVHELVLDISELKLGQSMRVRDISIPEHLQVMNTPGIPVASIMTPRVLRSLVEEGEEDEEGLEGEGEEATESSEQEAEA